MSTPQTLSDADDVDLAWSSADLRGRAERLLARARRALAVVDERPLTHLDDALVAAEGLMTMGRARIRELVADGSSASPEEVASIAEILVGLGDLREELRGLCVMPRLHERPRMRASLARMRRSESTAALREAAPAEAVRACGFARAMLVCVEQGWWVPVAAAPSPWVHETRVALRALPPEERLVRDGVSALVERQAVAAVRAGGRVCGLLYGDHGPTGRPADELDRDLLAAFAEGFGFVFERVLLVERFAAQREEAARAFADIETILGEIGDADLGVGRGADDVREPPAASRVLFVDGADGILTFRQRQVLGLMASGATTARIADELLISQTTVKTHVKHIMARLSARTRAEAVSRYLTLVAERRTGDG